MTSRNNLSKPQRELLSFIDGRSMSTRSFQIYRGSAISIDGIGRMDVLGRLIRKGLVLSCPDMDGMTTFHVTPAGLDCLPCHN